MSDDELTYASYLQIEELLDLQQPRSEPPEHDEILFIVVHQASELWFKELLHELDKIKTDFGANHVFRVISSFRRATTIVGVLTQQLDVLETMTPLSFQRFRDRLETSSGFQSMQFRELEFMLGVKRPGTLQHYAPGLPGREKAERRLLEPTVPDAFNQFLVHRGATLPSEVTERPVDAPYEPNEQVQDFIVELYSGGEYRILFEFMVDFDAALQEWRYRHVKLVERTIGNKTGTGGSLGVEFLKRSLFHPVFPDLWAIRHRF